jgi:sugar phosphate isomerase/epimerase
VRFGLSTHLFHQTRLTRDHLRMVADAGFDAIELFAVRSHVDYHDRSAIETLAGWLRETGVTLASVHAPIAASFADGAWRDTYSNASPEAAKRELAVREAKLALDIAEAAPYATLVLHVGGLADGDNQPAAARRSLEEIAERAAEVDVALALEVIPNALSTPDALVRLFESDAELGDAGVCLDVGHAHLLGDVVDAVETLSGYITTTHLHDNAARRDDHLLPFEGTIDWERTLLALYKVGFDGPLVLELAGAADPAATLTRAAAACRRLEKLVTLDGHP